MAEHPHWSRRRLSIVLCEALNWRTANGQLKDMSARLLLNKLALRGFIELPPRQSAASAGALRARTLYSECRRRGVDRGSATGPSASGGDPGPTTHRSSQRLCWSSGAASLPGLRRRGGSELALPDSRLSWSGLGLPALWRGGLESQSP